MATGPVKVFQFYNPAVLTFPRKKIMVESNKAILRERVYEFIKDKYGVDFVIVDDHAYIEYFDREHRHVIDQIPKESREVYRYKHANKIGQT
jgi:hypothetical protein